ncbi:MAG: hypothetical protein ACRDN0_14040 [Trebonia sp.]
MREQLVSTSGPQPWPGFPRGNKEDNAPADGQRRDCAAAVTEITSVMNDTRRLVLISGGLLAADTAGEAVAVTALFGHGDVVGLSSMGLLAPVLLSWLVAALLMILAERPLAAALGALRCATGAPVDPSAPWRPLGVRPIAGSELEWHHVVPLIGALTLQHSRARLALSWAVITTVGFMLWMALSFAVTVAS